MSPPVLLGGCELLQRIGAGAVSSIYRARERASGKIVAVKHVLIDNQEDRKYLRHADNEYRVLRRLQDSPEKSAPDGIVNIRRRICRGFLRKRKERILVMDYVDGADLRRENRFPLGQIVELMTQVAWALSGIHTRGYIHGDIKPENIMVSHNGNATLVDFGFACKAGSPATSIRGTREYMAPEQINCGRLTEKTDIYNLGATIYFLLTARHLPAMMAAQGDNSHFIVERRRSITPPREIRPEIPAALDAVVLHCVEEEPIARPASVNDVLAELLVARDTFVN